jgi:two-component system chemotaxis response regulator CheB
VRVLVIDDSAFMRKAIALMIDGQSGLSVIDTARNGADGLEKIQKLSPDAVTLDIEMPVMDGLTMLEKLKALKLPRKPVVLMCSTLTVKGSKESLRALRLGASDFIAKDPAAVGAGADEVKREMVGKLKALLMARARSELRGGSTPAAPSRAGPVPATISLAGRRTTLLAIGSSTGGPGVLEEILAALPKDFPAPIVVAQHMPAIFTQSMAERLAEVCAVRVVHGDSDMPLVAGTAYIIVGGRHGRVRSGMAGKPWLEVSEKPTAALYKPSVDELLSSAAKLCGATTVGVVLTGMGEDGKIGASELKQAGGVVIAQDEASSVVYGMPRAVVECGAAAAAMAPAEIARALSGIGRLSASAA